MSKVVIAALAIAGLALCACSKPAWRDPNRSKHPHTLGEAAALAAAAKAPKPVPGRPPIPHTDQPMPPLAPWAQALLGKDLRASFPQTGPCEGNTDQVLLVYGGASPGAKLLGWGWDATARKRIARVVLADDKGRIAGGGEGGVARPDVAQARPSVTDPAAGWHAYTPRTAGPLDAFGVLADGRAICPLGHVELG